MSMRFTLDLGSPQTVLATSNVDASVTIPILPPVNLLSNPNDVESWFWISVTGAGCFVNIGAAATAASNFGFSIGAFPHPVWLPPGKVLHAITSAGTGTIVLAKARIV